MGKFQWEAWRGMGMFREQMDRLLEEAMKDMAQAEGLAQGYVWTPLADVFETAQAFVALVELPGVGPEQVMVEIQDGELVVRGERPPRRDDPDTAYLLMECGHGAFARRFPLPEDADGEAVTASLREGLLTVTVPKRSRRQPVRRTLSVD